MRTPTEIAGAIRQRVEWLMKRNIGLDEQSSANWTDANRIDELLTELDAALIETQYAASLAMVKK